MTEYYIEFSLTEICHELQLNEQACVELVEYGIVNPRGRNPSEWIFDLSMVTPLRRALRLHRDLELDWSEIALISELLDERDRLRSENQLLRRQLGRFLVDLEE